MCRSKERRVTGQAGEGSGGLGSRMRWMPEVATGGLRGKRDVHPSLTSKMNRRQSLQGYKTGLGVGRAFL